jgi:hypothetical protein
MKKRLVAYATLVTLLSGGGGVTALAARNPSGSGQPGQDCVDIETLSGGTAPGNASASPGSPFNEAGLNSANGGIGGQHYDAAGAPSQYDVACYQVSQH